jgi:lipoate-protein ligase A
LHGEARVKVAQGKLVSVKVDYEETINSIKIMGDFFLHPEAAIYGIEDALLGMDAGSDRETFRNAIENALIKYGAEVIGADAASMADAVKKAIENGVESNKTGNA